MSKSPMDLYLETLAEVTKEQAKDPVGQARESRLFIEGFNRRLTDDLGPDPLRFRSDRGGLIAAAPK